MGILMIIYALVFVIFALIAFAVLQIKMAGMKVKDFWSFIEANQMLDKLYRFGKKYEKLSSQEQLIFLITFVKYPISIIKLITSLKHVLYKYMF